MKDEVLFTPLLPVSANPFLPLLGMSLRSLDYDLIADTPDFYPLLLPGAVKGAGGITFVLLYPAAPLLGLFLFYHEWVTCM